jgi:hypothetical protein
MVGLDKGGQGPISGCCAIEEEEEEEEEAVIIVILNLYSGRIWCEFS